MGTLIGNCLLIRNFCVQQGSCWPFFCWFGEDSKTINIGLIWKSVFMSRAIILDRSSWNSFIPSKLSEWVTIFVGSESNSTMHLSHGDSLLVFLKWWVTDSPLPHLVTASKFGASEICLEVIMQSTLLSTTIVAILKRVGKLIDQLQPIWRLGFHIPCGWLA